MLVYVVKDRSINSFTLSESTYAGKLMPSHVTKGYDRLLGENVNIILMP